MKTTPFEISKDELVRLADSFSYKASGDVNERTYGHLVQTNFPNSEIFWKKFVTPMTQRIVTNPIMNIAARSSVDPKLQHLTSIHYSVFLNLVHAHLCLQQKHLSYFENFYAHLGSVCDLAEEFIINLYLITLECEEKESETLTKLTKTDFLKAAEEWFDENYHNAYEHYLKKGKYSSVELPRRTNIIKEYYKGAKEYKAYAKVSGEIRAYRNVVVHNAKIGSWIDIDWVVLVPKRQTIGNYKTWHEIWQAMQVGKKDDFIERNAQMQNDLVELEKLLQNLWVKPIEDFNRLLYTSVNGKFISKYDLHFKS